ncbi:MAG: ATP-binding cassette domain-containing protein [Candidatus Schmidhempelia sp.]|nr:ATP-binding cassette domain-containing protein [Candidatus Schmidhempelia sp.]
MLFVNVKKRLPYFCFDINQCFHCLGITAILGVSGAGKSTFINLINGLKKPDKGSITLHSIPLVDTHHNIFIPPEKRNIGTVFQDALLFPHYKVIKNLTYAMHGDMQQRFDEIINVLNICHLLQRYPAMLSGGEKQRVAIARALLTNPQLLLMDEPLSALDMPRRKELLIYINKLRNEINIPIIYVTHNINEAKQIANYIAILEQGRLIEYGKTNEILHSDYLKNWL